MLTTNNITQQKTGAFESTSGTVSLDAGTEAGASVILVAGLGGDGSTGFALSVPSGFTRMGTGPSTTLNEYLDIHVFIKANVSAGESSWTLPVTGGTAQVCWAVFEMTNIDHDFTDLVYLDALPNPGVATTTVTSRDSNETAVSESYGVLALCAFFTTNTTPSTPAITSYTNSFFEIASQSVNNGTRAHTLTVAALPSQELGTFLTGASISPASYAKAHLFVFTGLDSMHAPNVRASFGAEIGTATSITATDLSDGPPPWDEVTGSPEIDTVHPRSGSYALKLSSSSAAENLVWAQKTAPQKGNLGQVTNDNLPTVWVERFHFYFEDLPAADTPLASCEVTSLANGLVIRYVQASQKIGVKIGSGSEQLSDATIAADQWIGIDYFYDPRTTTHTCAWAVDYNANVGDTTAAVAQTAASTSGMTAGGISKIRKGWTTSVTATVWMDDIVGSKFRKTYPIGDVQIRPLKVDPSGTPSISGSEANFKVFTSNGSMATWTAAGTRGALDDIPPTIGASSDGLAQVTVATTEYCAVPMETFTCAPDYVPVGGRWYWAGWAASGNPASIKFQGWDGGGTSVATNGSDDPGFDDTNLVWLTDMHQANVEIFYQLTQTRIDALQARFGFSPDANPDAGVHAVLFELIVKPSQPEVLFGSAGDPVYVEGVRDTVSNGLIGMNITTVGDGATVTYEIDGVSQTPVVVAADDTHYEALNATSFEQINRISLVPD